MHGAQLAGRRRSVSLHGIELAGSLPIALRSSQYRWSGSEQAPSEFRAPRTAGRSRPLFS